MKFKTKRLLTVMYAAIISAVSVVATTSSADRALRDANGDGATLLNDAILTNSYLLGKYNPTNVKSFDFDGNGVISEMDKAKIQQYLLGNIDDIELPDASTETVAAASTTRVYLRHDCSDEDHCSSTEYSLTVDLLDNSLAAQNYEAMPRSIIGENNMVADDNETAIVKIVDSNDNQNIGTGFIVGDHIVATAVHCVYTGTEYKDLTIKIVDENGSVIEAIQPEYIHVPKEAIHNTREIRGTYDYALLYFDERLSQYGTLKMGVVSDEYIDQHGGVIVSGFPGQYPPSYSGPTGYIRFKSSGNLYYSTVQSPNSSFIKKDYRLFYDADAVGGNSGGPVYVDERFLIGDTWYKYKTVIAIHSGGTTSSSINYDYFDPNYNSGLRVTPDVLKFYYNNSYLTE
ncbi:MAG: trypsin-like peptidase domain-containing protein [Ruminococcus sp.]|nr:trypsin-like peptidase domain-containing protein [Ruminococcus sp.]